MTVEGIGTYHKYLEVRCVPTSRGDLITYEILYYNKLHLY
jgi:hypothetical protein